MSKLANKEIEVKHFIKLLQRSLISAEETLDNIRIESFNFLCLKCCELVELGNVSADENLIEKCDCSNGTKPVEKRDCSIQTSPMFEIFASLPHIDSDEDENVREKEVHGLLVENVDNSEKVTFTGNTNLTDEKILQPKCLKELPCEILGSGMHLPGTSDVEGRPLIVVNKSELRKKDLTTDDAAKILMYFASLLKGTRNEKEEGNEITVLVVWNCDGEEDDFLFVILDKVFKMIDKYFKVHSVLSWIPGSGRFGREGHSHRTPSPFLFPQSNAEHRFLTDENNLYEIVPPENVPLFCGGRAYYNQEDWVEFFKEMEALAELCRGCGRLLRDFTVKWDFPQSFKTEVTAREIYQHQRAILNVLNDSDFEKLGKEGPGALSKLEKLARSLDSNLLIRHHLQFTKELYKEVTETVKRLRLFFEKRQDRIREMLKLRSLQNESSQTLSWIIKKGEPGLDKHADLAGSLQEIKMQEHEFETFYFDGMRHLDKGNDLVDEMMQCIKGEHTRLDSRAIAAIQELAYSLTVHLKDFGERLEKTREKLEDTSRCFYLFDKIYEWSLEISKYIKRLTLEACTSEEVASQVLSNVQEKISNYPFYIESYFSEILALIRKLNDEKLKELFRITQARYRETAEAVRNIQTRLTSSSDSNENFSTSPVSGRKIFQPKETFGGYNFGRRKSLGSFPRLHKCAYRAEGSDCSCDSGFSRDHFETEEEFHNKNFPTRRCDCILGSMENSSKETEENFECISFGYCRNWECSSYRSWTKTHLKRTCTWQYPTEKFEDHDHISNDSSRSDESDVKDFEEHEGTMTGFSVPTSVTVNSHLYRHPSDLSLDFTSSSRGEEESKIQKNLLLILREMVQTESDYVTSLEYVIENYVPELLREDIPQALRGQRNVIFGNIEKIHEFHSRHFFQELKSNEKNPHSIGQCFLRHEKKFYLYALYNKNKPKSDSLMAEYGSAFFKSKQIELEDKMDLASYLLKPVQRMGKYALLLQQLMKASGHRDCSELAAAEAMVRFQLRHGNDLLAMDSLRECDVNLKEQGRLLRQNEFLVWQGKGKKCLRHVFLFEELILFSKAKRFPDKKNLDIYIYKNSIKTTDIGLTAKVGGSPTKFEIWFRKRKPNDTYTMQSMSEEVKHEWIKELSALLWKQAMRNRELRLQEMTSMGIGNKPCLDIRPSSDQINDRSVSVALLTKTVPKFLITGTRTSQEFLASTNRPNSIISVTSSSSASFSSASTSSSRGSIGSVSHSANSPTLTRSTLHSRCSNESGIVVDLHSTSENPERIGIERHLEKPMSAVISVSLNSLLSSVTSPDDIASSTDNKIFQDESTKM